MKGKKDPHATVLNTALGQLSLSETACTTAPYLVKVKVDLSGLKPGVSKLSFKATAGKKTDKDKLVLTCNPGAAPSLADVVQPILTDRCFSTPTCHQSSLPRMESGDTYANTVGVASASFFGHGRKVIEPGSVKESYLARKILAKGLSRGDPAMPQGCPLQEPCLTDEETAQILTWIQAGAPNN